MGIAGTALSLFTNQNGGGILGNLLGNGGGLNSPATKENLASSAIIAEKDSKIAKLEAERYTDSVGIETYKASVTATNALGERLIEKYINPMSVEMCDMKAREAALLAKIDGNAEAARLREELMVAKIDAAKHESILADKVLEGKIAEVACQANTGLTALNGVVAALQNTVNGITKSIVPIDSVCPQPICNNAYVYQNPCNQGGCGN